MSSLPFFVPPPLFPVSSFPSLPLSVTYYTILRRSKEERKKIPSPPSPHYSSPIFPPYASFPFSKIPKMGNGGVFPHSKTELGTALSLSRCAIVRGCSITSPGAKTDAFWMPAWFARVHIQMGFVWNSPSIHATTGFPAYSCSTGSFYFSLPSGEVSPGLQIAC